MLFRSEDYKDCVAVNRYNAGIKRGFRKRVFNRVRKATRDNSRTPVQWSGADHAGFSSAEPWFTVNENYRTINVESEESDPASLLNFYRALIQFRTGSGTVRYGTYEELCPRHPHLYVYRRSYEGENLLILCSFTEKSCCFRLPPELLSGSPELLFSNYTCGNPEETIRTRPYETRVYRYRTGN